MKIGYSEQGDCFALLNEEFDYNKAIARILGRDVGRLLFIVGRKELSIQFRRGQFYIVTARYTKIYLTLTKLEVFISPALP